MDSLEMNYNFSEVPQNRPHCGAGRVKALAGASSNFDLLGHFGFICKISFLGR